MVVGAQVPQPVLAVLSCGASPAEVAQAKQAAGGFWVLRPDSGEPVEVVLMVGGCEGYSPASRAGYDPLCMQ